VIPYRRARAPSPSRQRRSTRVSREIIREERRPASSTYLPAPRPPSQTYVAVPAPSYTPIPAPQPVPVFVQPLPPPPPPPASHISSHHTHSGPHYVEVSPRSSVSSHSPSRASEYVTHEREYRRERAYSPDRSPQYETFRYVGAPEPEPQYERYQRRERSRSRVRERSRSRDYGYEDPRGSYRETNTRITVSDGRRRSNQYQR
jgi:hypothetical protein